MATQQGYTPIPGEDLTDSSPADSQSESSVTYRPHWSEEDLTWDPRRPRMSEDTAPLRASTAEDGPPPSTTIAKVRRCLCILATIFFIVLLAAAIVVLALLLVFVGQQPARVVTDCGVVEGNFDPINKVFSFKGVPYAAPPVRSRRWRPPHNQTCWSGIYKADNYPPACVQYSVTDKTMIGSEDCLYVNVFTPSVDPETLLPVMIYIHGGYLQWGDGQTAGYAPDERVTGQRQVVFVSIQYRLGPFGFLVSEALPGRRGNYGFLDQVHAMKWVQRNIQGFGGDPNNVTIFGQSSGGTSVWAHLMSPASRGLFHRAWMLSGSPVYNKTTEDAMADTAWLLPKLAGHCVNDTVTAKCLEDLRADKILKAMYPEWDVLKDSMDLPSKNVFEPSLTVVDGEFMPAAPFEMWANKSYYGSYSDVPVMIGTTAQELDLNPAPGPALLTWAPKDLTFYVRERLDGFGGDIVNRSLALYPWQHSAEYVLTTMATDVRMTCGNDLMAGNAATALRSPVYRYVVTATPSRAVQPFGIGFGSSWAFHSFDSFAFFLYQGGLFDRSGPATSDSEFARTLTDEVMHFVREGRPRDPAWRPYPDITALVAQTVEYVEAYHRDHCEFWLGNRFFSYAWIN